MGRRRVGMVWPEPVQKGHLTELRALVSPELRLDVEAVESEPAPEQDITLAHVEGLARDPNIADAAGRLAGRGAQAVGYGCTSGSYVLGPAGDAAIVQQMKAAAGVPATTTSSAAVAALRTLGAQSVAVLSPHIDDLNARLQAYLEAAGFSVAAMVGLNLRCDIEAVEPAETRHIVEVPGGQARRRRRVHQLHGHADGGDHRRTGGFARQAGRHGQPGDAMAPRAACRRLDSHGRNADAYSQSLLRLTASDRLPEASTNSGRTCVKGGQLGVCIRVRAGRQTRQGIATVPEPGVR